MFVVYNENTSHRRRSGVFIVNFEHFSNIFSGVYIAHFEQGNVSCVDVISFSEGSKGYLSRQTC